MKQRNQAKLFAGAIMAAALAGCAGNVPLMDKSGQDLVGKTAYTQHVIHPDRTRARIYTANYQLPDAIIPRCAKVQLLEMNRKVLKFIETDSGREFSYIFHKSTGEPIEASAAKTFAATCDKNAVNKLSKADKEGIKSGRVSVGMSKEGVLLAAGEPPSSRTPNLEYTDWVYWKNRFNTFIVRFNNKGIVTQIID